MIRKTMKVIAWALGGIVGVAVVLYLVVVAINWRDQEPSAEAIRFANLYRDRPPVADKDNAYIYLMGFGVAPGRDPREMGARRVAWIEAATDSEPFDAKGDPLAELYDLSKSRLPLHQDIVKSCRIADSKCAAAFDDEKVIKEWLSSEAWLLERYLSFIDHTGWRESMPSSISAPLPVYHYALDGQQLLFAQATEFATKNDYIAVKSLLARDVRFWREVLESSDILISKMIATAALRQHFGLANLVLRKLPPESAANAVPAEWRVSISDSERSMLRCYVGEWVFGSNLAKEYEGDLQAFFSFDFFGEEPSIWDKMLSLLSAPLFKLQDFDNKRAEYFLALSQPSTVPYELYPTQIKYADELAASVEREAVAFGSVYNPIGRILIGTGASGFAPYGRRVADLEGVRRAALVIVELRASNVPANEMLTALSHSTLRNPYNHEPFFWDADKAAVVFTGLQTGERRTLSLLY